MQVTSCSHQKVLPLELVSSKDAQIPLRGAVLYKINALLPLFTSPGGS